MVTCIDNHVTSDSYLSVNKWKSTINMNVNIPEQCSKQWEVILLLIASEEKKMERNQNNEIDTMNYFLEKEGVREIILQWLRQMQASYAKKLSESDTALKCDEVSLWWRQKGNENFRDNKAEESFKCYTKSVKYAHQNGPKYPLALANRSAALLRLRRFEECLADIELAIAAGYPVELRYKLFLRRADCYIYLYKVDKALEAMVEASRQTTEVKLSRAQTEDLSHHIMILEHKLSLVQIPAPTPEVDVIPDCYKGENPNFASASSVVELRSSETAGREVVTREKLHRGDVVFSEEPYAWVALPSDLAVCDGCCAQNINVLPCASCSRTVYCNEECRTRAAAYHRWECAGAQADLFPTIGIAHLALRVLLMSTVSGFPSVPPQCEVPVSAAELFRSYSAVNNIDIYKKDTPAFYRMFNLVTNFDKMKNEDYVQYALTATMLTLYLEHFTDFFEQLPSVVPYVLSSSQLRLFASSILMRALGQLVCNGHAVRCLTGDDENRTIGCTVSLREVRRATAIYPSASMMNHACDPNIVNTFYKARLIVRCSKDIASGSEVLNCYGPHTAREITPRRRHLLRAQYFFTCACSACLDTEKWDFMFLFSAFACQTCKGPIVRACNTRSTCTQCRTRFDYQHTSGVLSQSEGLLAQAERAETAQERIDKTHAAFRLQQQVLYRHNGTLRVAADHLARLYVGHGDFGKSVELIKLNIQSLEHQYGSFSVEVSHELRKLADVMLDRIINSPRTADYRDWCLETHKVLKKAIQLADLNFGPWEATVKQLKKHEAYVASLVEDYRTPDATDNVHHLLHYNLKI